VSVFQKFAGHSLRAGLASSAEVDERHVQKQLGDSSAEMTRRYQRDRFFRIGLPKVAGLSSDAIRQRSMPRAQRPTLYAHHPWNSGGSVFSSTSLA
jgi:integrase